LQRELAAPNSDSAYRTEILSTLRTEISPPCVPSKANTVESDVVNGNVVLGGRKKSVVIVKRGSNIVNPSAFVVRRREVVTPCGIEDIRRRMTIFSFRWGTKSRSNKLSSALAINKGYNLVNMVKPGAYNYLKVPQAFKASAVATTRLLITYVKESCEGGP
jgi:hypothetical protein